MSRSIALGLFSLAIACAHQKPAGEIWLDQLGINQCAPNGTALPGGHITLWMVMLADGTVPAAFIHDSIPRHDPSVLACFVDRALFVRKPPQESDAPLQTTLVCNEVNRRFSAGLGTNLAMVCGGLEGGRVEQPLDEALARDTLKFADWSEPVDRGWGLEYAGLHEAALAQFRQALLANSSDARAQRGLAQSLVSNGGDLSEARAAALEAVRIDPASAGSHEALLRVCLAAKDDACAVREYQLAIHGAGAAAHAFLVALLDDQIQAATDRLNGHGVNAQPANDGGAKMEILAPDEWLVLSPRGGTKPFRLNADVRPPTSSSIAPNASLLPVLFLPGLGGGVRDYAAQLSHLAKSDRKAAALELPGEGFSDPPPSGSYGLDELNRDLGEAMDALKMRRALLVAHGLAASIAIAFASKHPERVAGLLLIDPFADLTLAPKRDVQAARDALSSSKYLTNVDAYDHQILIGARESTRLLVLREAHRLTREAAEGYFELAASLPIVEKVRALRMPVRLLNSSYSDEPFSLGARLPQLSAVTVAETSPWIMLDAPEAVNIQLDAMLERLGEKP